MFQLEILGHVMICAHSSQIYSQVPADLMNVSDPTGITTQYSRSKSVTVKGMC